MARISLQTKRAWLSAVKKPGARCVLSQPFVDFYEVLQLSPRATAETIERVYRLLAKRYHPDNTVTGDAARFSEVHETILSSPYYYISRVNNFI